jgi:hypothetical protein
MSQTLLRQRAKTQFTGSNIFEVLHPYTGVANPATLIRTSEEVLEAVAEGSITYPTIEEKVEYDLKFAHDLYDAFEVSLEAENKVTLITAAIEAYTENTLKADDSAIKATIIGGAVSLLQVKGFGVKVILAMYERSNESPFVTTLEAIADNLKLSYNAETSDTTLAEMIKAATA